MPLNPVAIASENISDKISSSYSALLDGSNAIRNHVTDRIREWELASKTILDTKFPFLSQEQDILNWQNILQTAPVSEKELGKAVDKYIAFCKEIGHPANESFGEASSNRKQRLPKTLLTIHPSAAASCLLNGRSDWIKFVRNGSFEKSRCAALLSWQISKKSCAH